MSARNAVTAVATLTATAALWDIRPPFHQLAPSASLTVQQLTTDVYLAAWLGLLLVCLSQTRRLLHRLTRPNSATNGEWMPLRRPRPRSAPLALPQALPQMMFASQTRPDLAASFHEPQTASPTETHTANDLDVSDRATVLLLGPLTVTGARAERHGLRAAALELVAYLALHPHGATRDELLEALWPDQDPRKTRGRLYQATRDARRLLGENAITRTKENYQLDRQLVTVDVDQLADALATATQNGSEEEIQKIERASTLVRGEPLAGSDYRWAAPYVRQLRGRLAELFTRIARARLEADKPVGALEAAERGLQIDAFNEELWRLALASEGAAGLRTAVEDRYRQLKEALDRQLGLSPSSETRALYRRLLAQA
jgi:DNA-binding SARP family transcriptional activator